MTFAKIGSCVALLVLLAITSSASGAATARTAASSNITVRITADPTTINPTNQTTQANNQTSEFEHALYDTLVSIAPSGKVVPQLAAKFGISPYSIQFTLKKGATCADGTPITPSLVENSFNLVLHQQGAKAQIGAGPFTMTANNKTGRFTWATKTANNEAIYWFATAGYIVCPAGVANPTALENTPQGSGPYVLTNWVRGDHATLTLRPNYNWGPLGVTAKTGLPKQITFKVVADETTAANLLLTGGLNVGQISGPDESRAAADKKLTHFTKNGPLTFPLQFMEDAGHPTADPVVRHAIMAAINRTQWNKVVYNGEGVTSPSFLAPGSLCYDASVKKYLPANPGVAAAQAILKAGGWTLSNGKFQKNGQPLTIDFPATTTSVGNGPEYIDSALESAGFTVNFEQLDFNSWLKRLLAGTFDIAVTTNSSVTPAPSIGVAQIIGPHYPAGYNWGDVQNPAALSEWALAKTTFGTTRCTHWSNVQKDLLQHYDFLPLAAPVSDWFATKGISIAPGVSSLNPLWFKVS